MGAHYEEEKEDETWHKTTAIVFPDEENTVQRPSGKLKLEFYATQLLGVWLLIPWIHWHHFNCIVTERN